jgi:hypothetical protein
MYTRNGSKPLIGDTNLVPGPPIDRLEVEQALELQTAKISRAQSEMLKDFFQAAIPDVAEPPPPDIWIGTGDVKEGDIVEVSADPSKSQHCISLFAESGSDAAKVQGGIETFCGAGSEGVLGVYVAVQGTQKNGCAIYRHSAHPENQAPADADKYIWFHRDTSNSEWIVGWHSNLANDTGYMRISSPNQTGSMLDPELLENEGGEWKVYSDATEKNVPLNGIRAQMGNWEFRAVKKVERDSAGQAFALTLGDTSVDKLVPVDVREVLQQLCGAIGIANDDEREQRAYNTVGAAIAGDTAIIVATRCFDWMLDNLSAPDMETVLVASFNLNTSGARKCQKPTRAFIKTASLPLTSALSPTRVTRTMSKNPGVSAAVSAVSPDVFSAVAAVESRYKSTFQLPEIMHTATLPAQRVALTRAILAQLGAKEESSWENVYNTKDAQLVALGLLQQSPATLLELPAVVSDGNGLRMLLTVLATLGDGNCLFHATSLDMWGVHDYKKRADVIGCSPRPNDLAGLRAHFNRVLSSEDTGMGVHARPLQEFRRRWVADRRSRFPSTQVNRLPYNVVSQCRNRSRPIQYFL